MNSKGREEIACAAVREQFTLLLYGELSFDQEERVESHLDTCVECRTALEREKALHAAFDSVVIEPPVSLLRECREDLQARLMEERAPARAAAQAHSGWWDQLVDALTLRPGFPGMRGWLRPVGALTLVALGFFAARVAPLAGFGVPGSFQAMGLAAPESSRVRNVETAADGQVQIVLDETRPRLISGRLDDQQIRALLLGAAKDPSDPGLRAETVNILNTDAELPEVRGTLVFVLRNDENEGVRLRAMEGLKAFTREPDVRGALTHVLLSDSDAGLRTQAIDLLTAGSAENLDRQIVGTLQELMNREENSYVRQRSRMVLELMKASAETY
jgi:anti-sigma factor RsiW